MLILQNPFHIAIFSCFRCKAKGKISKNDKTKLVLTVGHENNHVGNNIVSKFR